MGLFSRSNPYEKAAQDLEEAMKSPAERPDQKSRPAPAKDQLPPQRTATPTPAPSPQAAVPQASVPQATQPKAAYTIEDVILLMRELPDSKKEMVVTIVQKTLISAKINIHSIIDDAAKKIDRLEKKNEKLGQEIRELEQTIIQRKTEMDKNFADIDETSSVKGNFEAVFHRSAEEPRHRPTAHNVASEVVSPMNLGSNLIPSYKAN